ncbi:DUF192 domain-containing protein [Patescibacteria group bacterium]|nr:DUF192 domain-containing protein [Patescibacteria group bacterium]
MTSGRPSTSISLILLALLFLVCIVLWQASKDSGFFMSQKKLSEKVLSVHGTRILVDVADTEATRAQGLSGRAGLSENGGLLMIFDEDVAPGIWMKDMNFPIDIVWIDANWTVVDITPSIGPDSYPNVFYPNDVLVRYVLELPAGFADIHNIEIGNTVSH